MSTNGDSDSPSATTSTLGHVSTWDTPWTEEHWRALEEDIESMRERLEEADRIFFGDCLEDAFGIKPEES